MQGRGRAWKVLAILIVFAAGLVLYGNWTLQRQIAIATGPVNDAQRQFIVEAADRPEIESFFRKNLKREQKLAFARNLGEHAVPEGVKVIVKLLTEFDPEVRRTLTDSLVRLAQTQGEALRPELDKGSSFQRLAVFEALRSLGPEGARIAAGGLAEAGTRNNAAAFLVEQGAVGEPYLLRALDGETPEERILAAESLAKLRSRAAVSKLLAVSERAETEGERDAAFAALATIADPSLAPLLTARLNDARAPRPLLAQAAIGLGRTKDAEGVRRLWQIALGDDLFLREAAIEGLREAGDVSLELAPPDAGALKIAVAGGIESNLANETLRNGLAAQGRLQEEALKAVVGRSAFVGDLTAVLRSPRASGRVTALAVDALYSTEEGRYLLETGTWPSDAVGFIKRRQSQSPART